MIFFPSQSGPKESVWTQTASLFQREDLGYFFFLHLTFTLQIILIKLIRGVKDTFRLMRRSPYHRGAVPKADLAAAVHAS